MGNIELILGGDQSGDADLESGGGRSGDAKPETPTSNVDGKIVVALGYYLPDGVTPTGAALDNISKPAGCSTVYVTERPALGGAWS